MRYCNHVIVYFRIWLRIWKGVDVVLRYTGSFSQEAQPRGCSLSEFDFSGKTVLNGTEEVKADCDTRAYVSESRQAPVEAGTL